MNNIDYQEIINEIYTNAQETRFGCDNPNSSLNISNLSDENTSEIAALVLIEAFKAKYDLVSIMQAAIEKIVKLTHEKNKENG